jgi:hypothetical protein
VPKPLNALPMMLNKLWNVLKVHGALMGFPIAAKVNDFR